MSNLPIFVSLFTPDTEVAAVSVQIDSGFA